MRSWFIALVLAMVAIAPIFYIIYLKGYDKSPTMLAPPPVVQQAPDHFATIDFRERPRLLALEPGVTLKVLTCKVKDGYRYELLVEGNRWIKAHLTAATTDQATRVVIDWLGSSVPAPPKVTLLRKVEDYWIVDLCFSHQGKSTDMVDMLRSQKLLLY